MHCDDTAAMSIDKRLNEVASLLAVGFLRLKRRTGCLPPDAFSSPDPSTCESAESSKIPPYSPCHFSESLALCDVR